MRKHIVPTLLSFFMSGVALAQICLPAQPRQPLEVVLDFANGLALVPEGTIIPPGVKIYARAGKVTRPEAGDVLYGRRRLTNDGRKIAVDGTVLHRENSQRFVFAYAPESVFLSHRKRSEAMVNRVRAQAEYCTQFDTVYSDHPDPQCVGCSITLVTVACIDPIGDPIPQHTLTFTTTVSPAVVSAVQVSSLDNYFSCSNSQIYATESVSCSDGDTRYPPGNPPGETRVDHWGYVEFWQNFTVYYIEATRWDPVNSVHRACSGCS
jgi:hypothetical protein